MEAEIIQQNKIMATTRGEMNRLKKSVNELQYQIANLSITLRDYKVVECRLGKEVVHSTDRIRFDGSDAQARGG